MRSPNLRLTLAVILIGASRAGALDLNAAEFVSAGGADLVVAGYSVPTVADWNQDDLPDLVVGEGGGTASIGKVRIYLNQGGPDAPAFAGFAYAQAAGVDLAWPASGCQGLYPRVVDWDDDGCKDLVVGLADGRVRWYRNVASDAAPSFDAGTFVTRAGTDLDVGSRATPIITDWDGDDRQDLVVGAMDGRIRVYLNSGTPQAPVFVTETVVQADGADLLVPSGRSSPCLADLDDDGTRDLLCGNTEGQVLLYHNAGTDQAPDFAAAVAVTAAGIPIDLEGTPRSRPCLCDWDGSRGADVLVGSGDGKVRLYRGNSPVAVPEPLPAVADFRVRVAPNPFNPRATFTFELARPEPVVLTILTANGQLLWRRDLGPLGTGRHALDWDGCDGAGRAVASGVYLVNIESASATATTRTTLVR